MKNTISLLDKVLKKSSSDSKEELVIEDFSSRIKPEDEELEAFMRSSIYRDEPEEAPPAVNPWEGKFDRRKKPR